MVEKLRQRYDALVSKEKVMYTHFGVGETDRQGRVTVEEEFFEDRRDAQALADRKRKQVFNLDFIGFYLLRRRNGEVDTDRARHPVWHKHSHNPPRF